MIEFPSNPLDYTSAPWADTSGVLWIYNSVKSRWSRYAIQATFVQDSPTPTGTKNGQWWFLPTTGALKCWYNAAWVDVAGGGASDVGDLTTTGLTSGNMVRVAAAGGLEERTPANVLSDIGAAAASHAHGLITSDGKIGGTAGWPLITGEGGVIGAGSFDTVAGSFAEGNDPRIVANTLAIANSTADPTPDTLAVRGEIGELQAFGFIVSESFEDGTVTAQHNGTVLSYTLGGGHTLAGAQCDVYMPTFTTNTDYFIHTRPAASGTYCLTADDTGIPDKIHNGTVTGYLQGAEQAAPAAPSANGYRIYAEDNGAGKTRLMVLFATGVAQQIAIEP